MGEIVSCFAAPKKKTKRNYASNSPLTKVSSNFEGNRERIIRKSKKQPLLYLQHNGGEITAAVSAGLARLPSSPLTPETETEKDADVQVTQAHTDNNDNAYGVVNEVAPPRGTQEAIGVPSAWHFVFTAGNKKLKKLPG